MLENKQVGQEDRRRRPTLPARGDRLRLRDDSAPQGEESRRPRTRPGDLGIVQEFLNTVDLRTETDELADPQTLAGWLSRHGFLDRGVKLTREDAERARDVRDGLRALLLSAHGDAELDRETVRRLDEAARTARTGFRFLDDGSARFRSETFDDALGHLLTAVVLTRRDGLWERLKVCADSECRIVFYDSSKNRSTRFCTRRCGARVRARSYRTGETYQSHPYRKPPRLPGLFRPFEEPDD